MNCPSLFSPAYRRDVIIALMAVALATIGVNVAAAESMAKASLPGRLPSTLTNNSGTAQAPIAKRRPIRLPGPSPLEQPLRLPMIEMAPSALESPSFDYWQPQSLPSQPTGDSAKSVQRVGYWEPEITDPITFAPPLSDVMAHSHSDDFSATPLPPASMLHDPSTEQSVYDNKHAVPTQRPLIEWGRRFYGSGITPPSETWLGETNLVQQQVYLYGDYRTGIASGRNDFGRIDNWASRLNLDLDYRITATERFHAFFGPLNRANQFSRVELVDDELEYQSFYNLNPVTAFFEGDAGALLGGAAGTSSPAEVPITAGLVPLVFQNGVWLEDAVSGVAVAIPARHSRLLNWSNFDATFFAIFDQINSPAFGTDNHAAQGFGTAWFIDAYGGYIETGYAYLNDRDDLGRSYHNATFSFTRRYFDKISNSVRVIVNTGQDLDKQDRTADGVLLLVENSLVTAEPLTVVPYFNLFAGYDRPQSVARAGVSGGVLRNTGINFEIDGLNGYPTLDSTAADTAGGSLGVDLIGDDLDSQWLLEASYLTTTGNRSFVSGDQFALGTRYQVAISHRSIIRFDTMYGWKDDGDVYGSRFEYRWKF